MRAVGADGWWGRNWKWVVGLLLVAAISAARPESGNGDVGISILNLGAWALLIVGIVESWKGRRTPSPAAEQPPPRQPVAAEVPPMWAADPYGRYELRYWDGSRWSGHVSTAGLQSFDPTL
jgi:hypothetical protein